MVRRKGFWIGRVFIMLEIADDGKWDWTSDVGEKHTDFANASIVRRPNEVPLVRLSLGPFQLLAARKQL